MMTGWIFSITLVSFSWIGRFSRSLSCPWIALSFSTLVTGGRLVFYNNLVSLAPWTIVGRVSWTFSMWLSCIFLMTFSWKSSGWIFSMIFSWWWWITGYSIFSFIITGWTCSTIVVSFSKIGLSARILSSLWTGLRFSTRWAFSIIGLFTVVFVSGSF